MVLVSSKPIVFVSCLAMVMHFLQAGQERETLPCMEKYMTTVDFITALFSERLSENKAFIREEVMRGARNSLFDVKYTLLPTMEFINEVKKANSRALQLLKQRGFLLPEKGIGEAMG